MNFFVIFFGIVSLFIIWLILDFCLGRQKHHSSVRKMETPILHGDFDIFTHGKELFHDYFSVLREAERHIHVLFYIVKDDAFSQEFLSILKEKARTGVEVRLLLDRLGSWKVKGAAIKELRAAGVEFAFSNPVKLPYLFYSMQVRNHRKISIIDGRIGYLGGFNIGKEYIDEEPRLGPWRDYHLKINSESVNFLQSEFLMDWERCTGVDLQGEAKYFPKLPKGAVRQQFIPTEADQLESMFISLIQLAEKSITIGTPYFIPSRKIHTELQKAVQRGVCLTIIVPSISDHALVKEASFRYLRTLLREGALVYQYNKGFYHAKTIVIDNKVADIGTANFDKRSLFLNQEINCYIYDPNFIDRIKDILNKDIHDSTRLTLEQLNKPNLARSLKEAVAGVISYFL